MEVSAAGILSSLKIYIVQIILSNIIQPNFNLYVYFAIHPSIHPKDFYPNVFSPFLTEHSLLPRKQASSDHVCANTHTHATLTNLAYLNRVIFNQRFKKTFFDGCENLFLEEINVCAAF